jgi:hypothetical protein
MYEEKGKDRCWVHDFFKKREQGACKIVMNFLRLEKGSFGFSNYLRMSPEDSELWV